MSELDHLRIRYHGADVGATAFDPRAGFEVELGVGVSEYRQAGESFGNPLGYGAMEYVYHLLAIACISSLSDSTAKATASSTKPSPRYPNGAASPPNTKSPPP